MNTSQCKSVVCFTFGSSDDSGAGRMGCYYAREFKRRGWSVFALCQPLATRGMASVIDRLVSEDVKVLEVPTFTGRFNYKLVNIFAEHLVSIKANLVISMHQQDMKYAGMAAKRAKTGYVVSGQNTFTFSGNAMRRWLASKALGMILNDTCSGVVATSDRVAKEFKQNLKYRGGICVQPNGVDTLQFRMNADQRVKTREKLNLNPSVKVFASVGRLTPQKNQIGLLEAFARAFPSHVTDANKVLWLVGGAIPGTMDGNYLELIKERIDALDLSQRVWVTGWRKDVADLLAAANVYVQPSLWEGSPLAVVEAMAARLPVIVADCGGVLPEFKHGVHGWVVPSNDVTSLAAALAHAAQISQEQHLMMGDNAERMAVECYDSSIVAGRFVDFASKYVRL